MARACPVASAAIALVCVLLACSRSAPPAPPARAADNEVSKPHSAVPVRSPLVQPGEKLAAPIPPRRLDLPAAPGSTAGATPSGAPLPTSPLAGFDRAISATTVPATAPSEPVPWQDAGKHVGQTITVQGKIIDTYNPGTVCFLNFTKDRQGTFYCIIFKDLFDAWPQPPQTYFINKTIRVTGKVSIHKDRPQIRIEKESQVTIVE